MKKYHEVERSIITKYRKDIYSKFTKAVRDYKLIQENDKIMVCISGGKDSFLLAKCMEELKRHGKFKFDCIYVSMNPGYSKDNLNKIKSNAKLLNIKLDIFESDVFDVSNKLGNNKPCYLCARMRRGFLYDYAKKNGCNKIALGHHFDDVIETTLISMFYAGELKTMMPKLNSTNFDGLELIRPLYLVKESDIISWVNYNGLEFLNCACKFTERNKLENNSKRKEIKELISNLRKVDDNIDLNIFNSLNNINLNCIIGTKENGVYHSFMDFYDDNK